MRNDFVLAVLAAVSIGAFSDSAGASPGAPRRGATAARTPESVLWQELAPGSVPALEGARPDGVVPGRFRAFTLNPSP